MELVQVATCIGPKFVQVATCTKSQLIHNIYIIISSTLYGMRKCASVGDKEPLLLDISVFP